MMVTLSLVTFCTGYMFLSCKSDAQFFPYLTFLILHLRPLVSLRILFVYWSYVMFKSDVGTSCAKTSFLQHVII